MSEYSQFDHPEILSSLFHPRTEEERSRTGENIIDLTIPVEQGVNIGGKIFIAGTQFPSILFFHGNGEIVIDYDDLGPLYVDRGFNFIPVDYRGYGRSNGRPTVSSMMTDCHAIFRYISTWLVDNGFRGAFLVMGRSLGSAAALELASRHADQIDGLIIESGFAYALPLLRIIGVNTERLGLREEEGFRNCDKIMAFNKPTLVIHAERDHIIPYRDGLKLFESSQATHKKMLTIPLADHNTIFMHGLKEYLAAVKELGHAVSS